MIEPVAPQGALAKELEEVARSATGLRHALKGANFLPDDFPRGDLDAVASTLELTPQMSADGALDALTYARPKLSQLRRRWVAIESGADDLPDVQRGGSIDQAITRLIADVDTAREWYYEARKAAAEDSEIPDAVVASGGSAEFAELAARAQDNADQSKAIADELADGTTPGSVAADNLVRRVRDVEVLSRQEGIELAASQPRLRLLDRLNRAVLKAVPYIQKALRAVEFTCDFAGIVIERVGSISTRLLKTWPEEIAAGARDVEQLIARHGRATGGGSSRGGKAPRVIIHVGVDPRTLPDLAVFKDIDAPWCPEMVVIPAGEFLMGSPDTEEGRGINEGPQHEVTIGYRFALGRYAVTFDEYDHFCAATKREQPKDQGWGRGRRPVIRVSWEDAVAYCAWLARETGQRYRLPSEAEWEYGCRAGTTTRYASGDTITGKDANFERKVGRTTEVGAYPPNPWGLHDMHGNVWEWCEDVWHGSYEGAPVDGSAGTDRAGALRMLRGGSWYSVARFVRSASRYAIAPGRRYDYIGFRCARVQGA